MEQEKNKLKVEIECTENKSKFGANDIMGVYLTVGNTAAMGNEVPLYHHIADLAGNPKVIILVLAFNVINGDSHASNKLAMFMIMFMILSVGYPISWKQCSLEKRFTTT